MEKEKKKDNWLTYVWVFALLVGGIFLQGLLPKFITGSAANTPAPSSVPTATKADVVDFCNKWGEQFFPGQVSYEWDKEKDTYTFFFWDESVYRTAVSSKAGYKNSQQSWADFVERALSICSSMQNKFSKAGFGTMVAFCAVDPSNHDNVILMVSKGKILYDATKD